MFVLTAELAKGLDDAARRLAERHNELLANLSREEIIAGRWIAPRLSDGECGPDVYDSRRDALRHVPDERHHGYVRVNLTHMPVREAVMFLGWARAVYANPAYRMPDPDREPIMPTRQESVLSAGGRSLLPRDLITPRLPISFVEFINSLGRN